MSDPSHRSSLAHAMTQNRWFGSTCLEEPSHHNVYHIKFIQLPSDMLVVPTEKGLLGIMDDFMGSGTASIMV